MKKFTNEYVKSYIENKGFKLISKYHNSINKLTIEDENKFLYTISFNNLLLGKLPYMCNKNNIYTIKNIKRWCCINNKSFTIISNTYINNNTNLIWQCLEDECTEFFEATWANIQKNEGCPYCSGKKVGLSNCLATKRPDLATEWHPTLNVDLTPFNVTCGSGKEVWWQCSINSQHIWQSSIYSRKNCGCPYCAHLLPSETHNLLICNPELCKEWNYEKNDKRPEEYCPNSNKYAWWKCKDCDNEWKSIISDRSRKDNRQSNCPKCGESAGENKISNFLNKNNIFSISQKTYDNLIGIKKGLLSYDFYLPNYNLLIEYQGEFHDGNGNYYMKHNLKRQQEHDKRKREYADKHNIKLLEIWYWDFDNIEEILEKELGVIRRCVDVIAII